MERNAMMDELWRIAQPGPEKCEGCGHDNNARHAITCDSASVDLKLSRN